MKIGIIGDTHGDTLAWERALVALTGCGLAIHCGDILNHGIFNPILPTYAPRLLADSLNTAPFPLVIVKGNCDSDVDQTALGYPIEQHMALIRESGRTILAVHGENFDDNGLAALGRGYGVDLILRGHTHEAAVVEKDGLLIVNPGSASLPKEGPPTVAMLDVDEEVIKVIDIEKQEILVERGM